jgi:hypothetical protein
MTEPSFNEDAPNFWAMTDEAWASFEVWKAHNPGAPETELAGLDFAPTCETCGELAIAYTEYHPTGICTHPVFEDHLLKQLVCQECLDELDDKSQEVSARLNPRRCFRKRDAGRCPSCKTTIQKPEDVLSVIRWLK